MTITRSCMTPEAIEELINQQVIEALATYEANHAAKLVEESQTQNGDDGENGNGRGNGNVNGNEIRGDNGNGNRNRNDRGAIPVAQKYQVKYVTCTLLNSALTWWNAHKRTIGANAAFAMSWRELMKLMTEMVLEEEDRVEKLIGGLPDNIQGNVIAAEPTTRLQDVVRIANNLMDQKLKGYAVKNAKNKRRLDNNQRDNHVQQPLVKRQNVVRAYTAGNNEKRGYVGPLPYCNKCNLHHEGQCTMRCSNCKKVGHMARDCKAIGHYRSDCPKLKNQNRMNKTGNKINETRGKAYVLGRGEANPDYNIVTGTFLLNNHYASMLFDSGADRSFVSTSFSALLNVVPSTLDVSYAVELADGRIMETNTVLRG
ncbi:putative reverse transcriptase domain-containing protein [Tanacetum coccineum]